MLPWIHVSCYLKSAIIILWHYVVAIRFPSGNAIDFYDDTLGFSQIKLHHWNFYDCMLRPTSKSSRISYKKYTLCYEHNSIIEYPFSSSGFSLLIYI